MRLPRALQPRHHNTMIMARSTCLAVLFLVCTIYVSNARNLRAVPTYEDVADALDDAEDLNLKTLRTALEAADLSVPDNAAWTIFAPTDAAFASADIKKKTGLTAAQLLEPKNRKALVAVLQFHIVPSAAITSSQLKDGQKLITALKGATPLTVSLTNGAVKIKTKPDEPELHEWWHLHHWSKSDDGNNDDGAATVTTPDVKAGRSVIHVIDKVLIPPSLVKP